MFLPNSKILVVDDMATMRKLVGRSLKELGFSNITEAADGALAWEAINSADPKFDFIVSDWSMPNCTGLDLLKRIRADGRFKKLPVVLVTAESEKDQVIAALTSGVSGSVIKPFDVNALREQLEKAAKTAA